ncbi:hypothetical protein ACFQ5N_11800 [Lutibacter holmesii]|uniref:Uncharacterized protein n=1 Tax=Lutibacter holmesii TaxID=1137985 RepID=A0ABW3WQJ1_9FLAO
MKTQNTYKTIKVPLFNKFKIVNNKLITEQEIKENSSFKNGLASIGNKTTIVKHEFILPKNHTQNIDFESDVTITYEVKNNQLHVVEIDALYAEDYIENIESNFNIFPTYNNGYITFNSDNDDTTFNTAC